MPLISPRVFTSLDFLVEVEQFNLLIGMLPPELHRAARGCLASVPVDEVGMEERSSLRRLNVTWGFIRPTPRCAGLVYVPRRGLTAPGARAFCAQYGLDRLPKILVVPHCADGADTEIVATVRDNLERHDLWYTGLALPRRFR